MDLPPPANNKPIKKDNRANGEDRVYRWTDYNEVGLPMNFVVLNDDMSTLPAEVVTAIGNCQRNTGRIFPHNAVIWNLCVFNAEGTAVLHSAHLEGGTKSGSGCAEDALWVTEKEGSAKNRNNPNPAGCVHFESESVIYIIDGGLCPCQRCCGSFMGLAKERKAHIVVRPLVDYEFVHAYPTTLNLNQGAGKQTYFLYFGPDGAQFTIYHDVALYAPTHLVSQVKVEAVVSRSVVYFGCKKGHYAAVDYGATPITKEKFKCHGKYCTAALEVIDKVPLGKTPEPFLRPAMELKK